MHINIVNPRLMFSNNFEMNLKDMESGIVEVLAEQIKILNRCNAQLPFHIQNFHEVNLIADDHPFVRVKNMLRIFIE